MSLALIYWLPMLAVAAYLAEAWLWPGGFPDWLRRHHPDAVRGQTRLEALAEYSDQPLFALFIGWGGPEQAAWLSWWVVLATAMAISAGLQILRAAKTGGYVPGMVSAVVLFLPLAVIGSGWLVAQGAVTPVALVLSVVVGIAYEVFAVWMRRVQRRKRA